MVILQRHFFLAFLQVQQLKQQNRSGDPTGRSADREISRLSWNPKAFT